MSWFTEERTPASVSWMPVVYRDRPQIGKDMRVGTTDSRARSQAVEIAPEHRTMSLTALRGIYGASPKDKGTNT